MVFSGYCKWTVLKEVWTSWEPVDGTPAHFMLNINTVNPFREEPHICITLDLFSTATPNRMVQWTVGLFFLVLTLRVIRIELLYWIIPFQSNNSTWPANTCVNYCNSPQDFETWKFAVKRSLWHATLSYRTFILVTLGKIGAHHLGLCCLFTASLGYEVIFLPTTLCHTFHKVHLQAGSSFWFLMCYQPAVSGGVNSSNWSGWKDWWQVESHGKTREPITAGMELLSVNMPRGPDPLSVTANNQWVVCDPRNLWPTSKVCKASEFREGCKQGCDHYLLGNFTQITSHFHLDNISWAEW